MHTVRTDGTEVDSLGDETSSGGKGASERVANSFKGASHGPVVQARNINGGLVFQLSERDAEDGNQRYRLPEERLRLYSQVNDLLYEWSNALRRIKEAMRREGMNYTETPTVDRDSLDYLWGLHGDASKLSSKVELIGSEAVVESLGFTLVEYYMTVQVLETPDILRDEDPHWGSIVAKAISRSRSLTDKFKEDLLME